MQGFKLVTKFKPSGDQPRAIKSLVSGLEKGYEHQTLLGVTGSGKTFTVANVIERRQKPTLVIAHNKTLAAQLTNEFRELFPHNSVNYFVSYYDYYQPEAYLPTTDTYIDKEALINDEIDKLRHAATIALLTRRDVIVVASVSCIYGLGAPEIYAKNIFHFKVGDRIDRSGFSRKLIELQFTRTNSDLKRGTFRLRGDNWEIMSPDRAVIYNFEVKGGIISKIYEVDPVRGFVPGETPTLPEIFISPAKHFITVAPERERAVKAIKEELKERLKYFEKHKKFLEAERLERRTKFDIAMMREVGYCHGIENYSRHLSGRAPGEPPDTLLDYFPSPRKSASSPRQSANDGFLTIIDESHMSVPQIRGMYEGDASRKRTLVEYGFRLPSAIDNRPLKFEEFQKKIGQVIYTSATPGPYELEKCGVTPSEVRAGPRSPAGAVRASPRLVEQVIRPTGLVDPKITIRPVRGQVDDLIPRIEERVSPSAGGQKARVLVTTLTKRMAEDLASFLETRQIRGGPSTRSGSRVESRDERSRTTGGTLRPVRDAQVFDSEVAQTRGGRPAVRGSEEPSGSRREKFEGRQAQGANKQPIKVAYLHSDIKTLERIKILTDLRKGKFDVLVGVNLLREGLDLPEVSLVAILDADKEGFLRSETSLIQTIGRASRNIKGEVLIYADHITGSVKRAVQETERRRRLQLAYNKKHHITPKTIVKKITDILPDIDEMLALEMKPVPKSKSALQKLIAEKEREMREAAKSLNFELAALLRDEIGTLSKKLPKKKAATRI